MHADHEAIAEMQGLDPHAARATGSADNGYDLEACERLMRGGSKTFFAASLVLPARVRTPAIALYAFCRLADDLIDGPGETDPSGQGALTHDPSAALAELHDRLRLLYAGTPLPIDADRALAAVVARFGIPQSLLAALLEGFAWDAQGRLYETLEDVHAYGARVAGTVGTMMALIMGTRSPQALARACELGVAMQLTNIARDVGEDARNGRLYLPRAWLREAGIDPDDWLRAPTFSPALAGVVKRLLTEADRLYRRAERGIAELPRDCRPAIQAARLVYAEIGREVERHGCDSVSRRAVVSGQRKLALIARALEAALWRTTRTGWRLPALAPLPAIVFLVEAASVAGMTPPPVARRALWGRRIDERLVRTIGLLERIETRNRSAHEFPGSGAQPPSVLSG
jgi:phytoene synthase